MADDLHDREPDRDARIRERAYHLWEADGKPYGRDVEFWQRARQIVAREEAASPASPATPLPARPAVPAMAAPAPRRRKPAAARKPQKPS